MWLGGAAFLVAAVFTLPALLTDSLIVATVFALLAAFGLGSANLPLNAARLDIVHSRLWGTAEAVRTTLVLISTGLAPVVFGLRVDTAHGLDNTFVIMLVAPVIAAALILGVARRTYHATSRRRWRCGVSATLLRGSHLLGQPGWCEPRATWVKPEHSKGVWSNRPRSSRCGPNRGPRARPHRHGCRDPTGHTVRPASQPVTTR